MLKYTKGTPTATYTDTHKCFTYGNFNYNIFQIILIYDRCWSIGFNSSLLLPLLLSFSVSIQVLFVFCLSFGQNFENRFQTMKTFSTTHMYWQAVVAAHQRAHKNFFNFYVSIVLSQFSSIFYYISFIIKFKATNYILLIYNAMVFGYVGSASVCCTIRNLRKT